MKEIKNYNIPLNYKEGTYKTEEITDFAGETINLECTGCEVVYRYITPKYNREVFFYECLSDDNVSITATYDSDSIIRYIKFYRGDNTKFIYINFKDDEHAKESILKYSHYWSERISEKILERKGKISRLFIEHFYDGVAVDLVARIGTPEDMQDIFARYGDDDAIDNCGDYPYENRIEADNETLGIILLCADREFCGELYEMAVIVMTEKIKENVLDKIDKTEDFKFLDAEYD